MFMMVNRSFSLFALLLRHGISLALLCEGGLLLGGVRLGQSNSVVIAIENCIELSHEDVSDEEHFFLNVHLHDCGSADGLGWVV